MQSIHNDKLTNPQQIGLQQFARPHYESQFSGYWSAVTATLWWLSFGPDNHREPLAPTLAK